MDANAIILFDREETTMENNENRSGEFDKPEKNTSTVISRLSELLGEIKKKANDDSDADPDPVISMGAAKDEKKEKSSEESEPTISIAEIMKEVNEEMEKEAADAARLAQQKKAVEEDEESARVALVEGLFKVPDGSDGPKTPGE